MIQPPPPLALSPSHLLSLAHFGGEAQPIMLVDNALADIELVRSIAARHSYRPIGPFYPGIRAAVSEKVAMPLVAPLIGQMAEVFGLARAPEFFECFLSIVTTAAADLAPIQRLPHFDGTGPERLAVLLYLSDDSEGGTAFYRQRATGYESVDAARFADYRARLDAETAQHGLPGAAYIGEDSPLFERICKVDGVANRLIVYRGNTLHCAAMPADFLPDPDPASGRLTLNLFLKA